MEGGGGATKEYKFSKAVSDTAREYLITGEALVNAFGGGLGGYANAYARVEIDKITVKYLYE